MGHTAIAEIQFADYIYPGNYFLPRLGLESNRLSAVSHWHDPVNANDWIIDIVHLM